jgi:hypothetical protein
LALHLYFLKYPRFEMIEVAPIKGSEYDKAVGDSSPEGNSKDYPSTRDYSANESLGAWKEHEDYAILN